MKKRQQDRVGAEGAREGGGGIGPESKQDWKEGRGSQRPGERRRRGRRDRKHGAEGEKPRQGQRARGACRNREVRQRKRAESWGTKAGAQNAVEGTAANRPGARARLGRSSKGGQTPPGTPTEAGVAAGSRSEVEGEEGDRRQHSKRRRRTAGGVEAKSESGTRRSRGGNAQWSGGRQQPEDAGKGDTRRESGASS